MRDAWLAQQHSAFYKVLDSALEHEEWAPVCTTKRVSASLVDLFQCLSQTARFYLDTLSQPWPGVHPSAGARRTLNDLLAEVRASQL